MSPRGVFICTSAAFIAHRRIPHHRFTVTATLSPPISSYQNHHGLSLNLCPTWYARFLYGEAATQQNNEHAASDSTSSTRHTVRFIPIYLHICAVLITLSTLTSLDVLDDVIFPTPRAFQSESPPYGPSIGSTNPTLTLVSSGCRYTRQ